MADLQPTPDWVEVYQLETTDPVVGGPPNLAAGQGFDNIPHLHLAQRTLYLRQRMDGVDLDANDDLDVITDLGTYRWQISTPANTPDGFSPYAIMEVKTDGTQRIQVVTGGPGNRVAVRRSTGSGTWSEWNRFWSDADAPVTLGQTVSFDLPNGFTMKMGSVSETSFPFALVFDTAFNNTLRSFHVSAWTIPLGSVGGNLTGATIVQTSGSGGTSGFNWLAIGT